MSYLLSFDMIEPLFINILAHVAFNCWTPTNVLSLNKTFSFETNQLDYFFSFFLIFSFLTSRFSSITKPTTFTLFK